MTFASALNGNAAFPTPYPYPGPGPAPFLPNLTSGQQPFFGGGLVDITLTRAPQPLDLLDADQYYFSSLPYTTAPHFPLPTLSLSSAEAEYAFDFAGSNSNSYSGGGGVGGAVVDSRFQGAPVRDIRSSGSTPAAVGYSYQPQDHDSVTGSLADFFVDPLDMPVTGWDHNKSSSISTAGQSARERAKNRKTTAPVVHKPSFEQGYLGGLDLNQKIGSFQGTYGAPLEKLILGKRHDGTNP